MEIQAAIERLQELQGQGVTHLHARNKFGELELVEAIAPDGARFRYDDGAALGVEITAQIIGPQSRRFSS
jgi:hypothetical protein